MWRTRGHPAARPSPVPCGPPRGVPTDRRSARGRRPDRDDEEQRVRAVRFRRVAVATALVALAAVPLGATADPRGSGDVADDLARAEREADRLAEELGERTDELVVAEEELAEIGARLDDARGRLRTADGQVALAEAALVDAEELRDAAREDHERAEALLASAEAELATAEDVLADQVVAAYKYGGAGGRAGSRVLDVVRHAQDPAGLVNGMKQLEVAIVDQDATVASVAELRDTRTELADEAAEARGRAQQAAADAVDQLEFTEELRAQAVALRDEIAAEEATQESLLADLRDAAEETEASLQRVAARQDELGRELAERRAAEEAARQAEAAREAAAGGTNGGGTNGGGTGGSSGGPAHGGPCPVVGAVAGRDFSNDWGYPRSGGRSHQGNDLFADRGTPIVAVGDGTVIRTNPATQQTGLGGITVTYRTADGSEWYNAHLDSLAEGIVPGATVREGETIGTVGNTGNARSTPPHLHLGRRHGGQWVNPWPTIAPLCR
ncbi:peptidoglycan DD-metalloendopeptidase family protein [Nitriliruptoraceae bacterium ZYF776]|nr:peptidoglycan DD-metalloendopeptidase family protein [Profundirhabdus halotolerans]